jgi:hypothetical protein
METLPRDAFFMSSLTLGLRIRLKVQNEAKQRAHQIDVTFVMYRVGLILLGVFLYACKAIIYQLGKCYNKKTL